MGCYFDKLNILCFVPIVPITFQTEQSYYASELCQIEENLDILRWVSVLQHRAHLCHYEFIYIKTYNGRDL